MNVTKSVPAHATQLKPLFIAEFPHPGNGWSVVFEIVQGVDGLMHLTHRSGRAPAGYIIRPWLTLQGAMRHLHHLTAMQTLPARLP